MGESHHRRFEGHQSRFDGATYAAVADEQHRAIGQALVPRGRPGTRLRRSHELRYRSLRREDQGQRHFGGRRLVYRRGIGERHVRRQDVGDAVVAERETLHECDVEALEILEALG